MAAYQLAPMPHPVAIFEHLIARQTQTLVIKEKLFDNFDVKDLNGAPWLHVEAKLASMHGRKKIYDVTGAYLFDIVKELFHWHTTFSLQGQNEQQLMQVKSKFALLGSKATATFTTSRGQPVSLFMKGNWLDTSADIVDEATGLVVARIDRQLFNAREVFLGHQTYHLTVAPGVDVGLLVAMCICLDEKQNEGGGSACQVM